MGVNVPTGAVFVNPSLQSCSGQSGCSAFTDSSPTLPYSQASVGVSPQNHGVVEPARLLEYLKEAVSGGAPISPEIARRVVAQFRDIRPPNLIDYQLTPHETRLLKLLIDGHNYKTAAVALKVSVNTIATHMRHVYEKLQVHSKSEAVAKALRNRLVR